MLKFARVRSISFHSVHYFQLFLINSIFGGAADETFNYRQLICLSAGAVAALDRL